MGGLCSVLSTLQTEISDEDVPTCRYEESECGQKNARHEPMAQARSWMTLYAWYVPFLMTLSVILILTLTSVNCGYAGASFFSRNL